MTETRHKQLLRMLKRLGITQTCPPSTEQWPLLLNRLSSIFNGHDEDRYLYERALDTTSKEMRQLNQNIRAQSESKLFQQRQRLQRILDSLGEAVIECDPDGKILFYNRVAQRMLALPISLHTPLDDHNVFRSLSWPVSVSDLRHRLQTQQGFQFETQHECPREPEQPLRDLVVNVFPLNQSKMIQASAVDPKAIGGFVVIARNTTAEKTAQRQMDKVQTAKTEFLNTMSHEIRTPLNGVIGISGLLKDTHLDENQQPLVDSLDRSAKGLLGIINDVLDYAKIEAGKMELHLEPVPLSELMDDMVGLFQPQFDAQGLWLKTSLKSDCVTTVMLDRSRIKQVLMNFIGNALKFTHDGGVVLDIFCDETHLYFAVTDTGIGIDVDVQPYLFEAFHQADSSTTRDYGGTGLGLNIVWKLSQLMKSHVTLTSEVGKGSCFTLKVPLQPPPTSVHKAVDEEEAKTGVAKLAGMQVLVVEDNQVNQLLVQRILQKYGIQVHLAVNGQEAVDKFCCVIHDEVNLILMDCQMPVLDGYAATERIRAWEAGQKKTAIPIVALTANAMEGDREKCLQAGMDDYLSKPVNVSQLEKLLVQYLAFV